MAWIQDSDSGREDTGSTGGHLVINASHCGELREGRNVLRLASRLRKTALFLAL